MGGARAIQSSPRSSQALRLARVRITARPRIDPIMSNVSHRSYDLHAILNFFRAARQGRADRIEGSFTTFESRFGKDGGVLGLASGTQEGLGKGMSNTLFSISIDSYARHGIASILLFLARLFVSLPFRKHMRSVDVDGRFHVEATCPACLKPFLVASGPRSPSPTLPSLPFPAEIAQVPRRRSPRGTPMVHNVLPPLYNRRSSFDGTRSCGFDRLLRLGGGVCAEEKSPLPPRGNQPTLLDPDDVSRKE